MPKTLFDKIWQLHQITDFNNGECLIYIDRIFLHERTGSIALKGLEDRGCRVRAPKQVFCTMDHIIDTKPGRDDNTLMPSGKDFIVSTRASANRARIRLFDIGDPHQGIAHVISPELGIALPCSTIVCPDSHSCTLGGIGAIGWGIGSTEAEHAMATNTLRVKKPLNMRVSFNHELGPGVSAKDMILHLIAQYGVDGGAGCAIEFTGDSVAKLSIEARMTLCNMAVEFSAFTGLVAADTKTVNYIRGLPYAPTDKHWQQAKQQWLTTKTDQHAVFDKEIMIDSRNIKPCVTWGTSPQHVTTTHGSVPKPAPDSEKRELLSVQKALDYMGLEPGIRMRDIKLDAAFIGSCTNSRLSDLRVAANYLKDKKIAPWITAVCVPGSTQVKKAAEAEGMDKIFKAAGFEWRESGCSMCFYAAGETFGAGKRVISSTNRNFEGRQGPGTRTHLASPLTVAASACKGYIFGSEE